MLRGAAFRPFATRGRLAVAAILLTFALCSTVSVALSVWTTSRSQNKATVVRTASRQRTLAERYVGEVLLARAGGRADPAKAARILRKSADALLDGGVAPGVEGDDDETTLPAATGRTIRAQLEQERRLVRDLTATGAAVLANQPVAAVRPTANERVVPRDPVGRLRVLAALTSNVSLNVTSAIAADADHGIKRLITTQVLLGLAGLLASLLLAWALVAATRRQTAHFRSLVTSSTDLVLAFGAGGCRYASRSVTSMLGRRDADVLGNGFERFVHPDDRRAVRSACANGEPAELHFRLTNRFGETRHLEAHVTDLRGDRHIRGVVLNARDVSERVRLEEQLTDQAFHDGLTGLANRALLRDRLDQALARSERSRELLAILLVDIDGFKQVNDSLGHDAGDQVLRQVARRFTEATRPSDTLARFGSDEFALLLEGADEDRAVAVAERLLERAARPQAVAGRELAVGTSVGIALHGGGAGNGDELIRQAEVAVYAAKEAGRGRQEVFNPGMEDRAELLGLEQDLRLALGRGELSLHYQPEIDLETRAIVGVEALLRWSSPSRGSVAPSEFISVAESAGLIGAIGRFALDEACRQTAVWRREGVLPDPFVTWVNLSGMQLAAGGVDVLVQRALEAAGLPPRFLGLEVTESTFVRDGGPGERARAELQELHDRGVRIAVDDFGTGFSGLGQLRRFPVDLIKVDRSFVQGIEHDARDAAITANLVALAHALELQAVAEGIESDGQLESVRELGCDLAQGFLFARPAPAGDVRDLLTAARAPASVVGLGHPAPAAAGGGA